MRVRGRLRRRWAGWVWLGGGHGFSMKREGVWGGTDELQIRV